MLQVGLATAGLGLSLPALAADPVEPVEPAEPKLEVSSEIGTNHGHEFKMTAVEALQHLRATLSGNPAQFDIRGVSNHGHPLTLTHAEMLELFLSGQVEAVAAGSHTHAVLIKLDVV